MTLEELIEQKNLKAVIRHDDTGKWAATNRKDKPFNLDKDFVYDTPREAIENL